MTNMICILYVLKFHVTNNCVDRPLLFLYLFLCVLLSFVSFNIKMEQVNCCAL